MNRRSLTRDRELANVLVLALNQARDRAFVRAYNVALTRARVLQRNLATFHPDGDLADALVLDRALGLANDLSRARVLYHHRDLAGVLVLALDRARDLARDLARDRDFAAIYNCALKLICDLERARDLHLGVREAARGAGRSMPGRVPRGAVALATRMLPAEERPRYREEFRVELIELPRLERLRYALRVLTHAWELRRVLTGAVRAPVGSPARRAER